MKREEQIISEAKKYYSDSINCHNAFLHGVEWADEHPVDVWHPVSEEPQGNNWKILCQDEENDCWAENRTDAIDLHNAWNEYVEIEMVVKWAYISDILPKGGEK